MQRARRTISGWAAVCVWAAGGAIPAAELTTSILYQDNVSRADRPAARESEVFARAELAGDGRWAAGRDIHLRAGVFAGAEDAFSFDELDQARAGVAGAVEYKAGLGPYAWRVELGLPVERDWFQDGARSRWLVRPELRLRKRVAAAWEIETAYHYDHADAESRLFDARGHEGGLWVRWTPGERWSVQAGYAVRQGDVVAYAEPPRPDLVEEADVIVTGLDTFGAPHNGYRIDARSFGPRLGVGYAFSERWLAEARYEWTETTAGEIDYDDQQIQIGLRADF